MKVFFYQRSTHRKRQQETVDFCPREIEVLRPDGVYFLKDTVLSARKRDKKLNLKSKFARFVPLNIHRMPRKAEEADYLYTWGCIPWGSRKEYVIEMDNPYCICYYNMGWFYAFKPLWKRILLSRRCKAIACISEACKRSIEKELGKKIAAKVKIVYPYIKKNEVTQRKVNNNIEFLFVSTQFYLKGGRETIEAFKAVYDMIKSVHLTVVTHLSEIPEDYKKLPFIDYVEANLDKDELHSNYFSKADVFILPSYQDSFGMVYLEALSFGLPIIATRMYAIPEMVIEGKNGILVSLPIHYFHDDYRLNPKYHDGSITKVIKSVEKFDSTVDELINAIVTLLNDDTRKNMSSYSKKLFDEKFSKTIRDKRFLEVFD